MRQKYNSVSKQINWQKEYHNHSAAKVNDDFKVEVVKGDIVE
jgi:hypothetical protein